MKPFNVYISGVGGQGIGLISEVMLRAVDHAGKKALGVDTHGLAQRGGVVASQLRIGDGIYSPVVSKHSADLLVSLERHETVRAAIEYLKPEGTVVYYNTSWQPLPVRLKKSPEMQTADVQTFCKDNSIKLIEVFHKDLPDPRMQNMALLAAICKHNLIDGVGREHYELAMKDLMRGKMLEANLNLFNKLLDK